MLNYFIAIILCVCLSAFFSAAEMSFSAANRMRLENASEDGNASAKTAVRILDDFENALSAILIGNNLVNIANSAIASVLVISLLGEEWTWLATVSVTLIVIVFGETMPKIIAKKKANELAMSFSYIILALLTLLKPIILIIGLLAKFIMLPFKGEKIEIDDNMAVEHLQSILETAEDEEVLDEERSELVQNALEFHEVSASEAMTARVDVVAFDIEDDYEDIMKFIDESSVSRIPVYRDSIDNVIGILSLNHLLKAMVDEEKPDIEALLMKPHYVYKTIKLPQVLAELKREKKHMAIVVDEFGGTLGLITMEDVLEEIVGEIWDENDDVEEELVEHANGEYELDGDMSIGDMLDLLDLREDDYDFESETVGGFTLEVYGGFPKENESFDFDKYRVEVLSMDGLRVERVLISEKKMSELAEK